MKILTVLTYYKPYLSGLTIYAQRIAEKLADEGHQVTVLTSQGENQLLKENVNGVEVIRMPIQFRLSKGVIMPKMFFASWRMLKDTDILHLHMPQFDASYLALFARLRNIPVIITYQCDLDLPDSWMNRIANWGSNIASRIALHFSDVIISTSLDYASHSPILKPFMHKVDACFPPIEVESITPAQKNNFVNRYQIQKTKPIIGMAGRLATEKGVEVLADAFEIILEKYPQALFIHVGNSENVLGEESYREMIFERVKSFGNQWRFLGRLSDVDLAAFYQTCDVLALPSLNRTEAFGMVQVEAMIHGTPVVASDFPGPRQPVLLTGMGLIVPVRDPQAFADAIIKIVENPENYKANSDEITEKFSTQSVTEFYLNYFEVFLHDKK